MSKYTCNNDFFKVIDNEEKAYWLGFLYADGCINEQYKNGKIKAMVLELGLSSKDENHIEKMLLSMESNSPIKQKKVKLSGNIYLCSRVNICNTNLCRDLIKLGCIPRKSLILEFPNEKIVPYYLKKHFIRGYFDGDGCISYGSNIKNKSLVINFVGTESILNGILETFNENDLKFRYSINKKGNAFQLFVHGVDKIKEIYEFMYDESNVYLDRKKEIFDNFFEYFKKFRKGCSNRRGVYFDKKTKKWIANITYDNKKHIIGKYDDIEEAILARKKAEDQKLARLNSNI